MFSLCPCWFNTIDAYFIRVRNAAIFFCLFNDTHSIPQVWHHTASNDGVIMNTELRRTWKEPVAGYFEMLSRHLFEEVKKKIAIRLVGITVLRVRFWTHDLSSAKHNTARSDADWQYPASDDASYTCISKGRSLTEKVTISVERLSILFRVQEISGLIIWTQPGFSDKYSVDFLCFYRRTMGTYFKICHGSFTTRTYIQYLTFIIGIPFDVVYRRKRRSRRTPSQSNILAKWFLGLSGTFWEKHDLHQWQFVRLYVTSPTRTDEMLSNVL